MPTHEFCAAGRYLRRDLFCDQRARHELRPGDRVLANGCITGHLIIAVWQALGARLELCYWPNLDMSCTVFWAIIPRHSNITLRCKILRLLPLI